MRQLLRNYADLGEMTAIAPVEKGGTGADNDLDAVRNLGGIHETELDVPGGFAITTLEGKLPARYFGSEENTFSTITITGPVQGTPDQVLTYTITNYDSYSSYSVSAEVGTISRNGDTVSYVCPTATGDAGFTINGREFTIPVVSVTVNAPSITSPLNNAIDRPLNLLITASAFSLSSGSDTHQSSDWQVARDSAFTNLVSQSLGNTTNKTSITFNSLPDDTQLYVRVRYRGAIQGYSPWSTAITFKTREVQAPINFEAVFQGGTSGVHADLTPDGGMVAYGPVSDANSRNVRVMKKTAGLWGSVYELTDSFNIRDVALSDDATLFILRNNNYSSSYVQVVPWNGTDYFDPVSVPVMTNVQVPASSQEAVRLSVSADGTRMAVLGNVYPWHTESGYDNDNAICVYRRDVGGTVWVLEAAIRLDVFRNVRFIHLNALGTELVAAYDPNNAKIYQRNVSTNIWSEAAVSVPNPPTMDSDKTYVSKDFTRIGIHQGADGMTFRISRRAGNAYALEQDIAPPSSDKPFQGQAVFNRDGTLLGISAISNPTLPSPGKNRHVHFYRRNGTTWEFEATVSDPWPTLGTGGSSFAAHKLSADGEVFLATAVGGRLAIYS